MKPRTRAAIGVGMLLVGTALLGLLGRIGTPKSTDSAPDVPSGELGTITETDYFTIQDDATGTLLRVPDDEFLAGAVVCEMPLSYADEALKAQAVAAYTVYDYQRAQRRAAGRPGADFTCDTAKWLLYTTESQMRARWGAQYDEYRARLDTLLAGLAGQRLTYRGDRVLAVYSAISGGTSEASAEVWGGALDYLTAVDSSWDREAPGYASEVRVSAEEFRAKICEIAPDSALSTRPADWIGACTRTAAGTVRRIALGDAAVTGEQLRKAFGLRSANFTLTYTDGSFCFAVRGYGHGVGMSQFGANYMAQHGADYRAILAHYYPGTEIYANS